MTVFLRHLKSGHLSKQRRQGETNGKVKIAMRLTSVGDLGSGFLGVCSIDWIEPAGS